MIAMIGDLGQQEDLEAARKKALATGASAAYVEDLREEFITGYIWPTLRAGAVYEHKYLLGTSFARPLLAQAAGGARQKARRGRRRARLHRARATIRCASSLPPKPSRPELTIIAPWREWKINSREEAIAYAQAHNIPVEQTKKNIYSRDRNIWHLSHEGGVLEDPANAPEESMWQWIVSPAKAPDQPTTVEIGFEAGTPVSVNGKKLAPLALLDQLNEIAAANGVGRMDIVENRLVGMKSRGAYETPGGTLLVTAHRELESLCLDRETAHYQQILSLRYAEMVYYGMWFTPLREALDAFFTSSQNRVTGSVGAYAFQRQRERRVAPLALFALSHQPRELHHDRLQPQGRRRLHQSLRAAHHRSANRPRHQKCLRRPAPDDRSATDRKCGAGVSNAAPTHPSTNSSAPGISIAGCFRRNWRSIAPGRAPSPPREF